MYDKRGRTIKDRVIVNRNISNSFARNNMRGIIIRGCCSRQNTWHHWGGATRNGCCADDILSIGALEVRSERTYDQEMGNYVC